MEIHIIDAENKHLYAELIDEYHYQRAIIFVEELKWHDLKVEDGRERDQFDTRDAVYFMAIHLGRLVGGMRRHCSLAPTLMSEIFPELASRRFDRRSDIYELTRFYVLPEWRSVRPNIVSGALHLAVWGRTMAEGGQAIQVVTWSSFVPHMMQMGLRPSPLGLPTQVRDMNLMAVSTPVDAQVTADLSQHFGMLPVPIITTGLTKSEAAA